MSEPTVKKIPVETRLRKLFPAQNGRTRETIVEAADEIEGLKEKCARLHAASCRDDDTIAALRDERDKVIAELAAVQSRLDAYSWEAENTALRAQVAALTKERDAWKQTCAHIGDELATHKTDAQRHLVEQLKSSSAWYEEQLATMTKERDHHKDWVAHLTKELAAAQAQIAQLREALETISDEENWGEDGCWESSSYPDEIAMEALTIPTDTSALDARLKDEYLKGFSDGAANYATEAIRSMK
jgi:chromosome segregation ATPase